MVVRSLEINPALVHCHAAMADMEAGVRMVAVMPDLTTGVRVHGPDVIRDAEIKNAVHQQRRTFQFGSLIGLKRPCEGELPDVLRSNLPRMAMSHARVIAVIKRPAIFGRMQEIGGIESLSR